jgi:hypothetical protein
LMNTSSSVALATPQSSTWRSDLTRAIVENTCAGRKGREGKGRRACWWVGWVLGAGGWEGRGLGGAVLSRAQEQPGRACACDLSSARARPPEGCDLHQCQALRTSALGAARSRPQLGRAGQGTASATSRLRRGLLPGAARPHCPGRA